MRDRRTNAYEDRSRAKNYKIRYDCKQWQIIVTGNFIRSNHGFLYFVICAQDNCCERLSLRTKRNWLCKELNREVYQRRRKKQSSNWLGEPAPRDILGNFGHTENKTSGFCDINMSFITYLVLLNRFSVVLSTSICVIGDFLGPFRPGFVLACQSSKMTQVTLRRQLHHLKGVKKTCLSPGPIKYDIKRSINYR